MGAAPVPFSWTSCGEPAELSVIVKVALRLPAAAGVKDTTTVQVASAARLAPQLLTMLKSPEFVPPTAMEAIDSAKLPLFVKVTV